MVTKSEMTTFAVRNFTVVYRDTGCFYNQCINKVHKEDSEVSPM